MIRLPDNSPGSDGSWYEATPKPGRSAGDDKEGFLRTAGIYIAAQLLRIKEAFIRKMESGNEVREAEAFLKKVQGFNALLDALDTIDRKHGKVIFPQAQLLQLLDAGFGGLPRDPVLRAVRQMLQVRLPPDAAPPPADAAKSSPYDNLPSPSNVALEIVRLALDEHRTKADVANVVQKDPATASRVLKYVNSAYVGLAQKKDSVEEAVNHLGKDTVMGIALSFSLVSHRGSGPCEAFNYEEFWSESLARASAAKHLAHQLECFKPGQVYTVGLLCQIGCLALATVFPEKYSRLLEQAEGEGPALLLKLERDRFGHNHNELAAKMMADWHLSVSLCDAVRFQDSFDQGYLDPSAPEGRLARTLRLAGTTSLILVQKKARRDHLDATKLEAANLGIGSDMFAQKFDLVPPDWSAMGSILDVKTRKVRPWAELYARAR